MAGPVVRAGEVSACSISTQVFGSVVSARESGKQPRNAGVGAILLGADVAMFPSGTDLVLFAGEAMVETEIVRLPASSNGWRTSFDADLVQLIARPTQPPRTDVSYPVEVQRQHWQTIATAELAFSDELDSTPPRFEGISSVWRSRNQIVVGRCLPSGVPAMGFDWPALDEAGFVTLYDSMRDGATGGMITQVLVRAGDQTSGSERVRVKIDGDPSRLICVRAKATDLAGNETPLSPVCCADERSATGTCHLVTAPEAPQWLAPTVPVPRPTPGNEPPALPVPPAPGNEPREAMGCDVVPGGVPPAIAWTLALFGLGLIRRPRR